MKQQEKRDLIAIEVMGWKKGNNRCGDPCWWCEYRGEPYFASGIEGWRPDELRDQLAEVEGALAALPGLIRVEAPDGNWHWPAAMAYGFHVMDAVCAEGAKSRIARSRAGEPDCAELTYLIRTASPAVCVDAIVRMLREAAGEAAASRCRAAAGRLDRPVGDTSGGSP